MPGLRHIATSAAILLAAATLAACAASNSDTPGQVIARVGGTPITQATLTRWLKVMAPQHVVPEPPGYAACVAHRRALAPQSATKELQEACRQQYQALRQQVLGFLISSQWLIGEAADEGMRVGAEEVKRRLVEKERSFPNGDGEFQESLRAIAHTVADIELEIQAELASERIRRRLISHEPKVTSAEIVAYYRRNIQHYHIPERRNFDIAENFRSAALARKVMREVRAGRSLAGTSLHESLPRRSFDYYNGEKRIIYEAIFKAAPHVLTGPIRLNNLYFLIEVTRVTPAYVQPLVAVKAAIARKLEDEQQRRTLAAFIAAWRRKWIAKTDCHAGYVVQKCRQYTGEKAPEDPLQLN